MTKGKTKIGIYGGSFNPVHYGHIGLAEWIVQNTDLDEIWLMISPNNPLKDTSILADEKLRLNGVQTAIKGKSGLKASDFEFHLPKPSYTANTLRELKKSYPDKAFTLVIGEDNWTCFQRWKEWEYILDNYDVWVYPRHSKQPEQDEASLRMEDWPRVKYLYGAPYFEISSTEIRKNLHN